MTSDSRDSNGANYSHPVKPTMEHLAAFDQLLQLYGRMESLLGAYASQLAEGHLATELLATLQQLAEETAETLASLSAATSAAVEPASIATCDLAAKKQQVLVVLSRILQCLASAEQRIHEVCVSLRPQTEALSQASRLHRAYELALATCAESSEASSASSPTPDNATSSTTQYSRPGSSSASGCPRR